MRACVELNGLGYHRIHFDYGFLEDRTLAERRIARALGQLIRLQGGLVRFVVLLAFEIVGCRFKYGPGLLELVRGEHIGVGLLGLPDALLRDFHGVPGKQRQGLFIGLARSGKGIQRSLLRFFKLIIPYKLVSPEQQYPGFLHLGGGVFVRPHRFGPADLHSRKRHLANGYRLAAAE